MAFGLRQIAVMFSLLSLSAIGGANATLPELHRLIVEKHHLMNEATFVNSVAVAQTAPGPNVMVISLIGFNLAGLPGLAVATLAMIAPSSLLALGVARTIKRFEANRWMSLLRRSLAPIAVGLMFASGFVMADAANRGFLTIAITIGMTIFIILSRTNPLWGIAAGAVLAAAAARFDLPT
jgi:chromate transporter